MGRPKKKVVLTITPDKLPNPWLVDSEHLLKELARIRELALQVPLHMDCVLPTNSVVDAIWRLEEQLRYLLHLHREGQRQFARKASSIIKQSPAREQAGMRCEM
jgi:hypothetical protein